MPNTPSGTAQVQTDTIQYTENMDLYVSDKRTDTIPGGGTPDVVNIVILQNMDMEPQSKSNNNRRRHNTNNT